MSKLQAKHFVHGYYRAVPPGQADDMVPTIHIDRSGAIWVGKQSGLDQLDPKTGTFKAYNEWENLPSSTVTCVLDDPQSPMSDKQRAYLASLGVRTVLIIPLTARGQANGRLEVRTAARQGTTIAVHLPTNFCWVP